MRDEAEDRLARLARAHAALLRAGVVEPLDLEDGAAIAGWAACDLASMVEGAFGERRDPATLSTASAQAPWLSRLGTTYHLPYPSWADRIGRRHWLLDHGRRVGTVQLPLDAPWHRYLPVHSLYVAPADRGRGIATRLFEVLGDALRAEGLPGVRIETHWTWQRAVRFYLRRGFWVSGWKRGVSLVRQPTLPPKRLEVGDTAAGFSIAREGAWTGLWHAERRDPWLTLHEHPLVETLRTSNEFDVVLCGLATFAVHLAMAGWPLIRSPGAWAERHGSGDVGQPEGLAYKIELFEAVARRDGWLVETPRLPGLAYRDLDDID